MENINEVMANEMDEVIYVAESITPKSYKWLKNVGKAGAALAVGYGIYRVAKLAVDKATAKKEQKEAEAVNDSADESAE